MDKVSNAWKQTAEWPGRLIGNTLNRTISGAAHGIGKGVAIPAMYAGGALAAGVGIPIAAYKGLEYLGEKGKTSELERRLALMQAQPGNLTKTASEFGGAERLLEKLARQYPRGTANQILQQQQRIRDSKYVPVEKGQTATKTRKVPRAPYSPNIPTSKPSWWGGLSTPKKIGVGTGVGLGAYGLYRLLRSDPQQEVQQGVQQ